MHIEVKGAPMSYTPLGYSLPPAGSTSLSTPQLQFPTAVTSASTASAATAGATPGGSSTPGACCQNGRPIATDPHTGATICSCQYNPSLITYPRVAGLTAENMYTTAAQAYAAAAQGAYIPHLNAADPSAFYSPLAHAGYDMKDATEAWRAMNQSAASFYYPYDPTAMMAAYPYGYGMDLTAGAPRKNATRETTSTLKAWLNEHRKNPYPTKGEKIMLAIITKMTLTQVSTWFANARRRLKKENKMTWSPRNRTGDDDDGSDLDDATSKDGEDRDQGNESDALRGSTMDQSDNNDDDTVDVELISDNPLESPPIRPSLAPTLNKSMDLNIPKYPGHVENKDQQQRNPSPVPSLSSNCSSPLSSLSGGTSTSEQTPTKPKIWSIADALTPNRQPDTDNGETVSKDSNKDNTTSTNSQPRQSLSIPTTNWVGGGPYGTAATTMGYPGFPYPYMYSPYQSLAGLSTASNIASSRQLTGHTIPAPAAANAAQNPFNNIRRMHPPSHTITSAGNTNTGGTQQSPLALKTSISGEPISPTLATSTAAIERKLANGFSSGASPSEIKIPRL